MAKINNDIDWNKLTFEDLYNATRNDGNGEFNPNIKTADEVIKIVAAVKNVSLIESGIRLITEKSLNVDDSQLATLVDLATKDKENRSKVALAENFGDRLSPKQQNELYSAIVAQTGDMQHYKHLTAEARRFKQFCPNVSNKKVDGYVAENERLHSEATYTNEKNIGRFIDLLERTHAFRYTSPGAIDFPRIIEENFGKSISPKHMATLINSVLGSGAQMEFGFIDRFKDSMTKDQQERVIKSIAARRIGQSMVPTLELIDKLFANHNDLEKDFGSRHYITELRRDVEKENSASRQPEPEQASPHVTEQEWYQRARDYLSRQKAVGQTKEQMKQAIKDQFVTRCPNHIEELYKEFELEADLEIEKPEPEPELLVDTPLGNIDFAGFGETENNDTDFDTLFGQYWNDDKTPEAPAPTNELQERQQFFKTQYMLNLTANAFLRKENQMGGHDTKDYDEYIAGLAPFIAQIDNAKTLDEVYAIHKSVQAFIKEYDNSGDIREATTRLDDMDNLLKITGVSRRLDEKAFKELGFSPQQGSQLVDAYNACFANGSTATSDEKRAHRDNAIDLAMAFGRGIVEQEKSEPAKVLSFKDAIFDDPYFPSDFESSFFKHGMTDKEKYAGIQEFTQKNNVTLDDETIKYLAEKQGLYVTNTGAKDLNITQEEEIDLTPEFEETVAPPAESHPDIWLDKKCPPLAIPVQGNAKYDTVVVHFCKAVPFDQDLLVKRLKNGVQVGPDEVIKKAKYVNERRRDDVEYVKEILGDVLGLNALAPEVEPENVDPAKAKAFIEKMRVSALRDDLASQKASTAQDREQFIRSAKFKTSAAEALESGKMTFEQLKVQLESFRGNANFVLENAFKQQGLRQGMVVQDISKIVVDDFDKTGATMQFANKYNPYLAGTGTNTNDMCLRAQMVVDPECTPNDLEAAKQLYIQMGAHSMEILMLQEAELLNGL